MSVSLLNLLGIMTNMSGYRRRDWGLEKNKYAFDHKTIAIGRDD